MRMVYRMVSGALLVAGLISIGGAQSREGDMAGWVRRVASEYDIPEGNTTARGPAMQDRFLARMSGLPDGDELQRIAGDLVAKVGFQDLVLTLPAYGPPLWKGNSFQADRFAVLVTRSAHLTPDQLKAWESALSAATQSDIGSVWVALEVLNSDQLFSAAGYRDVIASQFMGRLQVVPLESINAVADTVGLSRSQAAMHIAAADWAFSAGAFRPNVFAQGLEALRKSVSAK